MTLCARDVTFAYGRGAPVLSGVSVEVGAGVLAVIGANGSGKSTLLRVLGGVARAGRGRVELGGTDLAALSPSRRARRIALVAQRSQVSGALTVREVVRLGRYAVGADEGVVARAIERVGVTALAGARYHELSVGQQQRVSIARALAQLGYGGEMGGKVLLADEPTSALDPAQVRLCHGLLRELAVAGLAVCIATHDLAFAQLVGDRVLALEAGGRVAFGGPLGDGIPAERLAELFGTPFEMATLGGRSLAAPSVDGG